MLLAPANTNLCLGLYHEYKRLSIPNTQIEYADIMQKGRQRNQEASAAYAGPAQGRLMDATDADDGGGAVGAAGRGSDQGRGEEGARPGLGAAVAGGGGLSGRSAGHRAQVEAIVKGFNDGGWKETSALPLGMMGRETGER